MATPIILSIDSANLYDTGQIIVVGENFNSSETLLLINGISAVIGSITNNVIKAAIPRLFESKIYDVKVMTRSVYRYSKNEYSNSKFVFITSSSEYDVYYRTPNKIPPPVGYFKMCVSYQTDCY